MADRIIADEVIEVSAESAEAKPLVRRGNPPPLETRWKKGQSGNPSGKSKAHEAVRAAARAHGVEAINKLVELMRKGEGKIACLAAMALLDRGFGKAPQTIGDDDGRALGGVIFLPLPQADNE